MKPEAIVTDIEGTTSSIAFVADVLFPFSRTRLADYVAKNPAQVAPVIEAVRREAGPHLSQDACVALLLQWHDADRKFGPLKQLQGLIWEEGYATGAFTGHVYEDAALGLKRWRQADIPLFVYSSGSVAAQKLLFSHTDFGDLTPLFAGFFDTGIGPKREPDSYRAIAAVIGAQPEKILFLSDTPAELAAARQAGFDTILLARNGATSEARFGSREASTR